MTSSRTVIALLVTASCSWLATVSALTTYEGYGTVYSLGSPSDGNCNFMSWPKAAVTKYAALNAEQWEETMNCGRCAQVWCTDASCSGQSEIVYIMDQCSGCAHGDLDLSPDVFESITGQSYTKLSIEWKFVDCPISNNVQYCLKTGSSEFWVAVQPTNFVSGVASLSINGQKADMIDSAYYFLLDGCGTSVADLSSVSISMTGMTGEVLEETLSLTADDCTDGSWQFVSSDDASQTTIAKTVSTPTLTTASPTTSPPAPTPASTPTTASPPILPPTLTPTSASNPADRATFFSSNVTNNSSSCADQPTRVVPKSTNAATTNLISSSNEQTQPSSVSTGQSTALTQTLSKAQTPEMSTLTTPTATIAFGQEEASSSNGLHSMAAIVAVVCVALGVVGGLAIIVHKKRKRLEERNIIDDHALLRSYVSIRSPKSEVRVVHAAV